MASYRMTTPGQHATFIDPVNTESKFDGFKAYTGTTFNTLKLFKGAGSVTFIEVDNLSGARVPGGIQKTFKAGETITLS